MLKSGEARLRKARRIGDDISLTSGIRPIENKCKLSSPPGVHGTKRKRVSDYGVSLMEKQRFSSTYASITNKALRRVHKESIQKMKTAHRKGNTAADYLLMPSLEQRLMNVVYRMGFSATRLEARQLISHKAILVNNKVVTIKSFLVKENDVIEVNEKQKSQVRIAQALELASKKPEVSWVKVDKDKKRGTVLRIPRRDELSPKFQDSLVIQFYSK